MSYFDFLGRMPTSGRVFAIRELCSRRPDIDVSTIWSLEGCAKANICAWCLIKCHLVRDLGTPIGEYVSQCDLCLCPLCPQHTSVCGNIRRIVSNTVPSVTTFTVCGAPLCPTCDHDGEYLTRD